jgi:hypothetical protein
MGAVVPKLWDEQRLSRRAVLAVLPLLALAPPLPAPAAQDEILLVGGWVLRRSDLARL